MESLERGLHLDVCAPAFLFILFCRDREAPFQRVCVAMKARRNFSSPPSLNYRTKEIAFSFQHVFRERVSASQNGLGSHFALLFNCPSVI